MICCFLSCTCPLEEKSTRKFWFHARLAELSLIFLLSHSRSRAHEGESGKTEAPAKLSAPRSLHFFSINFAWLWWRKDDRSWSNLIAAVSKKYSAMPKIVRMIGLSKSKRTFTRVLLGYLRQMRLISANRKHAQSAEWTRISNTTTHLSTHVQPSVTSHAEDSIILPECNHEQEFSKPLICNWFQVLRFANATIVIQHKQQKQQKLIDTYFMINCSDEFLLKDTQPFISSVAPKKQD